MGGARGNNIAVHKARAVAWHRVPERHCQLPEEARTRNRQIGSMGGWPKGAAQTKVAKWVAEHNGGRHKGVNIRAEAEWGPQRVAKAAENTAK